METSLNLIPGMRADVGLISDLDSGGRGLGEFACIKETVTYKGTSYPVVNGWIVMDPEVGSIEPNEQKPSVIYMHKKPEKNTLCFFDYRDRMVATVSIIAVPIHDHSSISGGAGPAYATYFSDDESVE